MNLGSAYIWLDTRCCEILTLKYKNRYAILGCTCLLKGIYEIIFLWLLFVLVPLKLHVKCKYRQLEVTTFSDMTFLSVFLVNRVSVEKLKLAHILNFYAAETMSLG